MAHLARLHSKHLSQVAISAGPEGDADAHEIEAVTSEITRLFSSAKTKVKHLGDPDPLSKETGQEVKIKRNLTSAYALQLQDLMGKFRKSQEKYLARMKSREERTKGGLDDFGLSRRPAGAGGAGASSAAGAGVGGAGGDDDDMFPDYSGYVDSGFSFEQEQVVADSDALIQERSAEIQNIYRSIVDLAEMFKDMSLLVIEQGTLLDQIDYNVEQVVQHTESAVKQLAKGNEYHKKYRSKLIILLLIVMIVAMVIVLIARKKS
ncbi:syntaxin-16 [Thecamonas trahens ATCC 50062]|uniref:Syntaxin-16 n=1 Tax=Thecamonas trahens ATCC 50062 TaxID=461836 RepID=A0A0L0DUL4_THETB|nr:syntaxin-16 [Thecamonas trahens ATCC 50062]KNC55746.1 syntaxin-16 [Thecamonas trahens ATCC 50062]|eukprot:XP_013752899.1 syntaxin-16 [Thecamonas trahens ATCC 50062]